MKLGGYFYQEKFKARIIAFFEDNEYEDEIAALKKAAAINSNRPEIRFGLVTNYELARRRAHLTNSADSQYALLNSIILKRYDGEIFEFPMDHASDEEQIAMWII